MKDNEIEKAATDSCVIDNNIFNPDHWLYVNDLREKEE